MLPPCFPSVSTVRRWFYLGRDDGLWHTLNHHLVMAARAVCRHEASPSARVIDSQSVKTTEAGGPRGYDAGKKVKGRKRNIFTDTPSLGCSMSLPMADMLATSSSRRWPKSASGPSRSSSDPMPPMASKSCPAAGWSSAPWHSSTDRRLAKDFDRSIAFVTAWLFAAPVQLLARRIARRPKNIRSISNQTLRGTHLGHTFHVPFTFHCREGSKRHVHAARYRQTEFRL